MWTVKLNPEQKPVKPRGGKGRKAATSVIATFKDGEYSFDHKDDVEVDDASEREAFKSRTVAALAKDREGIAQAAALEVELSALLNQPPPA